MVDIKARRIELGLTQMDIAKAVGVSDAAVSKWESGHIGNMKRDKIAKLASVLRVSPAEFVDDAFVAVPVDNKDGNIDEVIVRYSQLSSADKDTVLRLLRALGGGAE